jgi:hypothetical protein
MIQIVSFEFQLSSGQTLKISEQEAKELHEALNRIFGGPILQPWAQPGTPIDPTWGRPIITWSSSDASNDPTWISN